MIFEETELQKLYKPSKNSSGEDNGQVTIIGGSALFHGAPFFSIQSASRIVDMVFFSSPHEGMREIAAEVKGRISSFIWVPWDEIEDYVGKSDAILIGPGFMRARTEKSNQTEACDEECEKTKNITKNLLTKFPDKKWVVDAGSLQVMSPEWLPENSIITPNKKEFQMLFGDVKKEEASQKFKIFIVLKGPVTYVYTPDGEEIEVHGGTPGLTKGGTGDTMAGLTVALLAKNEPKHAACSAAYVVKKAGEDLEKKQGIYFNADDLAKQVPKTLHRLVY